MYICEYASQNIILGYIFSYLFLYLSEKVIALKSIFKYLLTHSMHFIQFTLLQKIDHRLNEVVNILKYR